MKLGLHCLNPDPLSEPDALGRLNLILSPDVDDELMFILSPLPYRIPELKEREEAEIND